MPRRYGASQSVYMTSLLDGGEIALRRVTQSRSKTKGRSSPFMLASTDKKVASTVLLLRSSMPPRNARSVPPGQFPSARGARLLFRAFITISLPTICAVASDDCRDLSESLS